MVTKEKLWLPFLVLSAHCVVSHKPHGVRLFLRVCPKQLSLGSIGRRTVRIADNPPTRRLSSTVIFIAPLSHSLVCDAHGWMWSSQPAECSCVVFDAAMDADQLCVVTQCGFYSDRCMLMSHHTHHNQAGRSFVRGICMSDPH